MYKVNQSKPQSKTPSTKPLPEHQFQATKPIETGNRPPNATSSERRSNANRALFGIQKPRLPAAKEAKLVCVLEDKLLNLRVYKQRYRKPCLSN